MVRIAPLIATAATMIVALTAPTHLRAQAADFQTVHPDSAGPLSTRTLYLHIESLKPSYYEGESIQLTYWVENTGDHPEYYRRVEVERLAVVDSSGLSVPGCDLSIAAVSVLELNDDSTVSNTDWEILKPGEISDRWPVDLLRGQVFAKLFKCVDLPPGRYTISGAGIRSDTIVIEIIDPAGSSEEAAAIEFREIMEIGSKRGHIIRQGHFDLLEQFIEKYPNSAYLPRALGELLSGTPVHVIKASQRLVLQYPRYSYAGEAIWRFNPLQTPFELRFQALENLRIMEEVFAYHPPTRLRIESLINEIK